MPFNFPGALSAFYAIHETAPDLIVNAGTAGGFKKMGAAIGDAFVSTRCCHHDRRIPIPGFTEYGKGDYDSVACKNMIEVCIYMHKVYDFFCTFPYLLTVSSICAPFFTYQYNVDSWF
jgi:hypothetical protein